MLDNKRVEEIAKYLSRRELKEYLKGLKLHEKKTTVYATLPSLKSDQKKLVYSWVKKMFPKKQIVLKEDEALIAGVRIFHNDTVYEVSLSHTLNGLATFAGGAL